MSKFGPRQVKGHGFEGGYQRGRSSWGGSAGYDVSSEALDQCMSSSCAGREEEGGSGPDPLGAWALNTVHCLSTQSPIGHLPSHPPTSW